MNTKIFFLTVLLVSTILINQNSYAGRNSGAYDLAVSIDNYPDPVILPGTLVDYQVSVDNIGTATARRSRLTLALSPSVVPVAGLDSRCSVNSNNEVVCDLGNLKSGRGTAVSLAFDIVSPDSYQLRAVASARKSDSNNNNNQASHSFDAELDSITPYTWSTPNNVYISSTSNYSNGSIGVGQHYGTLYSANANGDGGGVIDGIISTYTLDKNSQTIAVTRGVFPGDVLASNAAAIDSVSYRESELNPVSGVDSQVTTVCLYDDNNAVYTHPFSNLFPVQSATQANVDVSTGSAWTIISFQSKLATFFPGGLVDIDGTQYTYTANRDEIRISDQSDTLVYHAVRSWEDQYLDVSPNNFSFSTGSGTISEFYFTP